MMKLTLVQFPATGCEVHIRNMHELWTLCDLPEEIETQENRQADVGSNEFIDDPWLGQKYLESVEQDDEIDE